MSDVQEEYDPIRWKAGVLVLVFCLGFVLILGRLFWVQVLDHARYRSMAKRQYESKLELRAERGAFYDRHRREVAGMMRTTSFAADPMKVTDVALIAQLLASATGEGQSKFKALLTQKGTRFVWLARGLNTAMYPELEKIRDPGLIRVTEPKRNFYYGPVGAQVLGTTDVDNNGLTGLELQYDAQLRGQGGFVVMQRDGKGRLRAGVNPERRSPRNGSGLILTLDIEFQRVVEQELLRGVRESGAASGTVVAMEPATGDILAIASIPTFDPNRLDKASMEALRVRAITDQYEPGSTMKTITAAALIEEGKLQPADKVDGLGGQLTAGPYTIRDDHPLGATSFSIALQQSSNVVFASASRLLDDRTFYKYVRDFGFGIPTGIDLKGEVRGVLRRPNQFEFGTKLFMAHGYGLTCTALQMLNAYAAIANDGVMMEPRLVRGILEPDGSVAAEYAPQRIRQVISAETANKVTEMLVGVVQHGTGTAASIPGVRIAGKTGTSKQLVDGSYAQKSAYTASFVGFYPAQNPRVVMIVLLDRPTTSIYGGTVSAPIFRRIVQKTMTMLNLDANVQQYIAASASADTVIVPDVRGLHPSTADTILQALGLKVSTRADTGIILKQAPLPGTRTERGSLVNVTLTSRTTDALPDVRGMMLRKAVTILNQAGYEVRIQGSGRVTKQIWSGRTCTLIAL